MLTSAYYRIKPVIPREVRMALRRVHARQVRRRAGTRWPISVSAGNAPADWTGWPENKAFACVLTHDVEGIKGVNKSVQLAELEMTLGYRSSFNFVPEGEYLSSDHVRDFLVANGFEVGVHDLHHDGHLYRSREVFSDSARRINEYLSSWGAVGFRSAFMLHNLEWLKELNVEYDASTFDIDPFEPQPDGVDTIFPFWVSRGDATGFVELPYTLVQDSTLFLILREPTIEIWTRKLDWIAARGGLALVNVHPDYVNFGSSKHSSEYGSTMYEQFLRYVSDRYQHNCWFALPRDVARYVRDRHGRQ